MNKDELKTGHIVEIRDGRRALVMKDTALGKDFIVFHKRNWTQLDSFSEDLIWHKEDKEREYAKTIDIVKIYAPFLGCDCLDYQNFNGEHELIWERKSECVELSIKDIERKLGISNIKIIK